MTEQMNILSTVGAIVIGRNEGERLEKCFLSLKSEVGTIVYVDSGSTDDSIKLAHKLGVKTKLLDMTRPFTAARARNEGFHELLKLNSDFKYVQFVDGDCEVVRGWLDVSMSYMEKNSDTAVVCGRRRERNPEKTIYNQLCDIEWETPIGLTKSCGGDALYRVEALQSVNGFRPDLIAGEESELCFRLREKSWKVWRLDVEMTLHDAEIHYFKQWWIRAIRSGYAYAEGVSIHGKKKEKHRLRNSQRIMFWGFIFPLIIIILSLVNPWYISLVLVYPLQIVRIALQSAPVIRIKWTYATFMVLGKFPEAYGQLKFWSDYFRKKKSGIIEYK